MVPGSDKAFLCPTTGEMAKSETKFKSDYRGIFKFSQQTSGDRNLIFHILSRVHPT